MYRNIDDDRWRIGRIEILPTQSYSAMRSRPILKQHSNYV